MLISDWGESVIEARQETMGRGFLQKRFMFRVTVEGKLEELYSKERVW